MSKTESPETDGKITISLSLSSGHVRALNRAFPGIDIETVANAITQIGTSELINFLSGSKRYLSLAHQHIEWIEQIYEQVLPEEECTYEYLYNHFNLPPGSASYIARVLRARQNSLIHEKSTSKLREKLQEAIKANENPSKSDPKNKRVTITLTRREYDVMSSAIDNLVKRGKDMELLRRGSSSKEFSKVEYGIEGMKRILEYLV